MKGRERNFYDMLEIRDSLKATTEQIELAYVEVKAKQDSHAHKDQAALQESKRTKEAFDCLKQTDCRSEY